MRVKRGTVSHAKHKKLLRSVKGYRMTKRRLVKTAKEAYLHAGVYAYAGRKRKKSDFRRLWITRISNYLKNEDISYSRFIHKLNEKNIQLDRKILTYLIRFDLPAFKAVLDKVKKG
ncbi:50S ribosomal protein L20 [Candidatus Gottesmanbacteria bacterium RIFCSPHIGHO2_02_FULL_40_24]|uniref:Large ribosomal subunit protein bL20 n=1 Tax=Candidatus Gottesmanbacteria bacterium RIFCSPHIGHO2_01_FULL_40_15 TaxID=1798376 RepID=A0A1F5Z486_9BACT|nr:MAG: 50S ribosomal protein L20 [Candidatus Gottesmanbacteria bacterium RIFCSPHIGHO2_01_FULL_40_15]OGG17182.1 MAG: 50S ribosomal protein L20 [Candidatus Gottesmanbacteria bacterium RIFCSPHIGHO2_02_FULL_40_24]OGG21238.1 MAG: 50S ribosomal protein L20 [Candidatus Gottesmanbacteria bacterium RIFCSPLOWO2_01_FULL_40_10]OGG23576.1 MAG: 50S ribosomal protein L20 [Candidatus Gottesmanbacteria bacterium RIFCSPHIGHO2_12_FULL_40_13]OGG32215.1 MAG: 50S ribosomal protein L20 [Candidatus Gottesmanbacteria 